MAKLTTTDISNITGAETTAITNINNNFAAVETAMENTLSRDGTSPNQMNADFDMNDNDILNVNELNAASLVLDGSPVAPEDIVIIDPELLALSQLTSAANKLPYFTGSGTASLADFTALGRDILAGSTNLPQFVSSRTALKALDTTKYTVAYLYENYRSGIFVFRSGNYSSQVTADTQEGIYIPANAVASSSGAWVRQYSGLASVDWFGAVPDDSTASEDAINAALSLCTVVTGVGDYAVEGPINLDGYYYGIVAPNMKITNSGTGTVLFSVNGWRSGRIILRRIDLDSGCSHGFSVSGVMRSNWIWVGEVYQTENAASYIYGDTGGSAYANTIHIPYCKTASAYGSLVAAAPIINWSISGISFVTNRIIGDYIYGGNAAPAIKIENTGAATYNTGNYIEVRTAELCDAGAVHLAGMAKSKVIVHLYDSGTTTDNLIKLYSTGSGNRCLGINLELGWQSGTIGGGLYHVALTNAYDTRIEYTPLNTSVKMTVDNNNMVGTYIVDSSNGPAVVSNVSPNYPVWRSHRLEKSATYNPPSLADGAGTTTTVTVTGAALGDLAEASFSLDLQGISVTAWVSAADTVSVRFQNESGGTLDLASGTLRAVVTKLTAG